jgi:hypothetical protein
MLPVFCNYHSLQNWQPNPSTFQLTTDWHLLFPPIDSDTQVHCKTGYMSLEFQFTTLYWCLQEQKLWKFWLTSSTTKYFFPKQNLTVTGLYSIYVFVPYNLQHYTGSIIETNLATNFLQNCISHIRTITFCGKDTKSWRFPNQIYVVLNYGLLT